MLADGPTNQNSTSDDVFNGNGRSPHKRLDDTRHRATPSAMRSRMLLLVLALAVPISRAIGATPEEAARQLAQRVAPALAGQVAFETIPQPA
jgi:hypothetical protein